MAQKQHVIHGRDHMANGADPIPGIGTGGGALDWEDTGTVTPAPTGLEFDRYVVFQSAGTVSVSGGLSFTWISTPAASYDPYGNVANRDASNAYAIQLLSAPAVYQLVAYCSFSNTVAMGAEFQGIVWVGVPAAAFPYSSTSGRCGGVVTGIAKTTGAMSALDRQIRLQIDPPTPATPQAVLIVRRISD